MLTINNLYDYQKKAITFQCTHPETMLWVDMGLGKTIITETSIVHLLNTGFLNGVLIVAPIRVIKMVWRQEALKWSHTRKLKFSLISGTNDQRLRALLNKSDIYLINYENIKWLVSILKTYFISKERQLPFDGIVWDEVSKMKNSTSKRCHAFYSILNYFKWSTGLTGTPASNGYKDLFSQYLMIDKGKRLGTSITSFKHRFYKKESQYKEIPYADTEEIIKSKISDITIEMSAEDYNPLPDLIINDINIELSNENQILYNQLEKELFVQLDNGIEIDVFNRAALTNKCLQMANGAVYPVSGETHYEVVHDDKLDALEDILNENQGQPILCAYSYKSDALRIMERFKSIYPINLTECKTEKTLSDTLSKWKTGKCQLLLGHPASMGHGIDGLQEGGNVIVWFGLNWSLELYSQTIARLRRQGQKKPIICHRLLITNTLDMIQSEVLMNKLDTETKLRYAIKQYRMMKGM